MNERMWGIFLGGKQIYDECWGGRGTAQTGRVKPEATFCSVVSKR